MKASMFSKSRSRKRSWRCVCARSWTGRPRDEGHFRQFGPLPGPSPARFRGPIRKLDPAYEGGGAGAAGLVDEGLAFLDVARVLAEGIGDVGLVGDQDCVGA